MAVYSFVAVPWWVVVLGMGGDLFHLFGLSHVGLPDVHRTGQLSPKQTKEWL